MKHRLCPVCKRAPIMVPYMDAGAMLAICSGNGCRQVIAKNQREAWKLWDERRFTDPEPLKHVDHK